MEDLEGRMIQHIKDILETHSCLCWDDEKEEFICDIYTDYHDIIPDKLVAKWCCDNDPMIAFYEGLDEGYEDCRTQYEMDFLKIIKKNWSFPDQPFKRHKGFITDWFMEHLTFILPDQHYLKQKLCVDIVLDTGDRDYEYVLNNIYPHYLGVYHEPISEKSSLLWLSRQQGYCKTKLDKALKKQEYGNSRFLESVRNELLNCFLSMNRLVFLVEMTLGDLLKLQEEIQSEAKRDSAGTETKRKKVLVIDKTVRCGFYDSWNGGIGDLKIELEKDVRLPINIIGSALPDGNGFEDGGYGMRDMHYVPASWWTPAIKKFD